jgi:PAS domain S-box-containing protein
VEDAERVLLFLAGGLGRETGPRARPAATRREVPDEGAARLRRMEARFRALVERLPAVTFMASLDGGLNEVYVSPQIEALLGYSQREWTSDPVLWFRRLHPDDRRIWNREFARGCSTGGPFRADCRFLARDGSVVWVRGEATIERDERGRPIFLQGLAYDITESKRAEATIAASLREKEDLLKEIHHRVKNNLQITSSLLKLQCGRVTDEASRRALTEGEGRIRAIALVHEMLYRTADLSRIDFAEYVRRLVPQMARAQVPRSAEITVAVEIDDVRLHIEDAVPCGLLLSELVSNCFKHAFPGERRGHILVRVRAQDGAGLIEVLDDGVGLPPGLDVDNPDSLGLELVHRLTRQLQGSVTIRSNGAGTSVAITLPSRFGPP